MESPSADPSSTPMAAESNSAAGASPLRSPMDVSYQPELSKDQMDRKKNLCMASEDNSIMLALPKETTTRRKRNMRAGGCNMRKSLAWNEAFLTEEGVLDSLELSLLDRSSAKPSRNLQSVSEIIEMSPLSAYNKSSIRPPLHDLGANLHVQVHKKCQNKVPHARKLFPSINEAEVHVISGKTPSAKGIPRSIPPSPATHSQKRVANVSTTNPTSKLLKFMPTKTHAAFLPSTSSNAMLITESSKSEPIVPKVNFGQGVGVKAVITKNNPGCPSSSELSAADHRRTPISQLNNGSTNSKIIPRPLSSAKLNEAVTSATVKAASSTSQGVNNVHGGPPPVRARPSALRMPSPSLGFFCQGKASPSYNNQSQRPTEHETSESKLPSLRKPMYLRREGELRSLTSTGHQPTTSTAAIKSGAGAGISSSSVAFLTAASEKNSSVDESMEVKQADDKDKKAALILGSSHCKKDGQTLSSNHRLLDHNNDNHAKSVFSGKCNPDGLQEASGGGRSLEVSNNLFAEGIPPLMDLNIPNHVQDACSSTRGLLKSKRLCPNTSSEIGFSKEIRGSDSREDNLSTQSHADVKLNETYTIITESKQSTVNSDVSDRGYGFAAGNTDCAQLEARESFNQRRDQIPNACLSRDIQPGNCSIQSSTKSLEAAIPGRFCVTSGLNSALSEEFEPTFIEGSRPEYDPKMGISPNEDVLTQGEKISNDRTKQGFPLGAVPFSDEWLAAVEAFGEDILEKKTGAVQNSPTDRSSPEPGPWSPVKRKGQDIGPYDCTKYSKNNSAS